MYWQGKAANGKRSASPAFFVFGISRCLIKIRTDLLHSTAFVWQKARERDRHQF
jgi:hypothetical protein